MAYQRQPQLNGAYYGPSIPPPHNSHRPGRSGRCCYEDQRIDTNLVDPFRHVTRNTTDLDPVVFNGQNVVTLGSDQSSAYDLQKRTGKFDFVLRMHLKVRFKIGLFMTGKLKPKVKCGLYVPLCSDSSAAKFETTNSRKNEAKKISAHKSPFVRLYERHFRVKTMSLSGDFPNHNNYGHFWFSVSRLPWWRMCCTKLSSVCSRLGKLA